MARRLQRETLAATDLCFPVSIFYVETIKNIQSFQYGDVEDIFGGMYPCNQGRINIADPRVELVRDNPNVREFRAALIPKVVSRRLSV